MYGRVMSEAVVTTLVGALQHDPSVDVRREAALALGKIDPRASEVVEALHNAVNDDNGGVRCAALAGLARNGDRDAAQRLLALMDESPEMAYDVAVALAATGDMSLVPAISHTLTTARSARVRSAAARALGRLAAGDRRPDDELFVWEDEDQRPHVLF